MKASLWTSYFIPKAFDTDWAVISSCVGPIPPEVKTYDEYSAGLNSFMSLSTSRIDELRGSMLLVLEPSFISVLTNCYYGGKLANFPSAKAEFTATEDRIIEIVSDGITQCLETAWKDLMPISIKHQSREINPQFATLVESSDSVIICSFVVQLPNVDSASFDIIYPLQTLKPIASLLRSRVQSDIINLENNRPVKILLRSGIVFFKVLLNEASSLFISINFF